MLFEFGDEPDSANQIEMHGRYLDTIKVYRVGKSNRIKLPIWKNARHVGFEVDESGNLFLLNGGNRKVGKNRMVTLPVSADCIEVWIVNKKRAWLRCLSFRNDNSRHENVK